LTRAVLAVDAGGTQTRALVLTAEGRRGTGRAGAANWTVNGPECSAKAIEQAVNGALRTVGLTAASLTTACIGLAGYYPPWHQAAAKTALSAILPGVALQLEPDLVTAWAGATGGRQGIVLAVGTGAVAYGRDAAGSAARAGGWGPLFGDEGGGYWIGCEALRAISRALDGRGPATSLSAELDRTRAAPEEALRAVYRDGWSREQVAALAGGVARHAAAGDPAAVGILERAAAELGALIAAVARRLDWGPSPPVVTAVGGVMEAGDPVRRPLERWLAALLPDARWTAPLGSPLDGALLLAQEGGLPCPTT
jgi:N-acetylglucosamine kinase-like BadF-type ATPase